MSGSFALVYSLNQATHRFVLNVSSTLLYFLELDVYKIVKKNFIYQFKIRMLEYTTALFANMYLLFDFTFTTLFGIGKLEKNSAPNAQTKAVGWIANSKSTMKLTVP